ncbi:hypothetical protein [Chryseobacterium sp. JV558]|uniref:oxidoreductase n=1 Tax=Chryseobacterium sp. JV558 TaxID=2663236 RepID=UPI00299D018D|nr:hypothetical protein [Chryseobacterium sp. JV558]MDW9379127.1 hypothetical protein [Chryseobacterium sp. JV558]
MDLIEIEAIQQCFVDASKRALDARFQLIEIHSAHGYLLNEFLSPLTNQRTDNYGGNRAKMLFETIKKVNDVWGAELPITVRISATDWTEGGWTSEDSVWLSEKLAEAGIDIVDVSTGGTIPGAKIPVGSGYQLPLASKIKRSVNDAIAVGTVGLITSAQQAEKILINGDADLIFMAREFLGDPYFPLMAHSFYKFRNFIL